MAEHIEIETENKKITLSDGASIAIRRWGEPKPERIVISHGNGLAVDGFRDFGAALAQDYEVIAFDMRNHGQSGPGAVLDDPWPRFLKDIPEIFDAIQQTFGEKPTHGAFHSLSSASTLMAQGQTPRPWQTLTLYEPPIPPATDQELLQEFLDLHLELSQRTRNRRRRFTGPDQLVRSFERSPTFGGISRDALFRLARAMMTFTDDGSETPWQLICDPEMEANTYDIRRACDYWKDIEQVETPVQIVLGTTLGHDMPILIRTATHLARTFGFRGVSVEGGGHLMQLQRPERSAEHAIRFARAQSENGASA